jgi:hypothetical protein
MPSHKDKKKAKRQARLDTLNPPSGTYSDVGRGLPDGGSYFLRSTGYDRCRPQYSGVEPSEPFSIPVLVPLVPLTFGPTEEEEQHAFARDVRDI